MVVDGDIAFFKENGPIEWFQFSLLLGATAVFLAGTLLVQAFNPLLAVLACVSAFAAARELDSVLDDVVPVLGWSVAFVFLLAAGTLAYRTRGRLADQVPVFLSSRAFVMLWAGFVVAVPFARLIGDARFLQSLMGEDSVRGYKRTIEESGELVGYFLIFAGSLESLVQMKAGARYVLPDDNPLSESPAALRLPAER